MPKRLKSSSLVERKTGLALPHFEKFVQSNRHFNSVLFSDVSSRANFLRLMLHLELLKKVVPEKDLRFCDVNFYINFLKKKFENFTDINEVEDLLIEINRKLGQLNELERESILDSVDGIRFLSIEEQKRYLINLILEKFADNAHEKYIDLLDEKNQPHKFGEFDLSSFSYEELSLAASFNFIEGQYHAAVDFLLETIRKSPTLDHAIFAAQRLVISYYILGMHSNARKLMHNILARVPRKLLDEKLFDASGVKINSVLGEK